MEGAEGRLISQPIWSTERRGQHILRQSPGLNYFGLKKDSYDCPHTWEVQANRKPLVWNKRTD